MNEETLAHGLIAQVELNFALIGVIFKLVDGLPSKSGMEEMATALREVLDKNSEVMKLASELVTLPKRMD